MFWTLIVVSAPTLFLLKTAIDYFYPRQIRRMAMKIGWNAMELYTKTEIYTIRLYNQYVPTILARTPAQPIIKFISDGEEIHTYTIKEFMKIKNDMATNDMATNDMATNDTSLGHLNYDFILYETPIIKRDEYAKYDNYITRYENIKDVLYIEYTAALKCFELNMIQMTLNAAEIPITIELGRNQYMLSGNILFDRVFLKWYLNKYCNTSLAPSDKYSITFIDHHMNYITLPDYCYLLIKKNGYDIVNNID
jgi:hypothetical protein